VAIAPPTTSHPVRGCALGSFEQVDELRWAQLAKILRSLIQVLMSPVAADVVRHQSGRWPRDFPERRERWAWETFRVDDEFTGAVSLWVPDHLRQRQFVWGLLGHYLRFSPTDLSSLMELTTLIAPDPTLATCAPAPQGGQMGVPSPSTTRQPPVAIAPDKAATFEAGTTLRSLTTWLQDTSIVPVAVYSFKSRRLFVLQQLGPSSRAANIARPSSKPVGLRRGWGDVAVYRKLNRPRSAADCHNNAFALPSSCILSLTGARHVHHPRS